MPRNANCATTLSETYCQIYCQKRGGEGSPGDGEPQVFSNLLIAIDASVGSNPTLSAIGKYKKPRPGAFYIYGAGCVDEPTGSTKIAERFLDVAAQLRRSGAKRRTSGPSPAASNPTLSAIFF